MTRRAGFWVASAAVLVAGCGTDTVASAVPPPSIVATTTTTTAVPAPTTTVSTTAPPPVDYTQVLPLPESVPAEYDEVYDLEGADLDAYLQGIAGVLDGATTTPAGCLDTSPFADGSSEVRVMVATSAATGQSVTAAVGPAGENVRAAAERWGGCADYRATLDFPGVPTVVNAGSLDVLAATNLFGAGYVVDVRSTTTRVDGPPEPGSSGSYTILAQDQAVPSRTAYAVSGISTDGSFEDVGLLRALMTEMLAIQI